MTKFEKLKELQMRNELRGFKVKEILDEIDRIERRLAYLRIERDALLKEVDADIKELDEL